MVDIQKINKNLKILLKQYLSLVILGKKNNLKKVQKNKLEKLLKLKLFGDNLSSEKLNEYITKHKFK